MRALVVYESMFGNTRAIAERIAEGLAEVGGVDVVEVGAAPDRISGEIELLVVGAPTHAFGLSRPSTRQGAADQAGHPLISGGIGVREWLDVVEPSAIAAATFDTKIAHPKLPGSAAHRAEKRLTRVRFDVVDRESFWVGGTRGPLVDGEADRPRQWGAQLGIRVGSPPWQR